MASLSVSQFESRIPLNTSAHAHRPNKQQSNNMNMMQAATIIRPSHLEETFQTPQLKLLHDVFPVSLSEWSLWLMTGNSPVGNLKEHSKEIWNSGCCCLFGATDKCICTIELAGVYGVTNRSYFDVKSHACKARWAQVGRRRQKLDLRTPENKILLILGL